MFTLIRLRSVPVRHSRKPQWCWTPEYHRWWWGDEEERPRGTHRGSTVAGWRSGSPVEQREPTGVFFFRYLCLCGLAYTERLWILIEIGQLNRPTIFLVASMHRTLEFLWLTRPGYLSRKPTRFRLLRFTILFIIFLYIFLK
jgi:hypothetical protein